MAKKYGVSCQAEITVLASLILLFLEQKVQSGTFNWNKIKSHMILASLPDFLPYKIPPPFPLILQNLLTLAVKLTAKNKSYSD